MAKEELLKNEELIHTTPMGVERIKKNLKLSVIDVVAYLVELIKLDSTNVIRKGKNYYCYNGNIVITVNASSYTIITAHMNK